MRLQTRLGVAAVTRFSAFSEGRLAGPPRLGFGMIHLGSAQVAKIRRLPGGCFAESNR